MTDEGPEGGERLWPGFLVVAILAVALTAVIVLDRDEPPPSEPAATPPSVTFGTDPTLVPATTQSVTTTSDPLPTSTQAPPTILPPTTTEAPTTTVAPTTTSLAASPISAARDALSAWGRFAVSGNLERLDGYFHPDGPQWEQLVGEADAIAQDPPGPPPYEVTLRRARVVESGANGAVVRGRVTFVRRGEPKQRFRWDLVMVPGEQGEWLLWTVAERG